MYFGPLHVSAIQGTDLVARYYTGSSFGTVGTPLTFQLSVCNEGDTSTPDDTNITVEMYVDGQYISSQQFIPEMGYSYAFGMKGGAYSERIMDWSWTPVKDGVHLMEFKVVYDNYSDVDISNNIYVHAISVSDPDNAVRDYIDFGNTAGEAGKNVTSSGGGTDYITETVGNMTDTVDVRYTDGYNTWFSASVANTDGKYSTMAIREIRPTISDTYRDVIYNPDQVGTGTDPISINVNGAQGQTFTTGAYTTYIPSIALQIDRVGLEDSSYCYSNLILRIYESPYKNKVLGECALYIPYIEGNYNWVVFNFDEDVAVLPNTSYYFELTTNFAFDENNRVMLRGYNTSSYSGGVWYNNGIAQTGKTLAFKTGPDITTTYDVQINGAQVGGYDQLSSGSNMISVDVRNDMEPGQTFTVGSITEIQAIAVALDKVGTIPANNVIKLQLHESPNLYTENGYATEPYATPIIAEAVLTPDMVPGNNNLATFVFPSKVIVYPGRRYYFGLKTSLAFDVNNKYTVGVFTTSDYTDRGCYYNSGVKYPLQTVYFKTGANPTFNTRSYCDKGNGAYTYYIDFPKTYTGSSISVKFVNKGNNAIYIDKIWNYVGFNTCASRYDTPYYYTPQIQRSENVTSSNLSEQVDLIKNNVQTRSDSYLGGNAVKVGFTIEHLYALRNDLDPSSEITYITNLAKSKQVAAVIYYNSTWGGTPVDFQSIPRYEQITYCTTDYNDDFGIDTLGSVYANEFGYGRTVPNVWGSTPWLTNNNGSFTNPEPGTLNRHKLDKMSISIKQLNENLFDFVGLENGAEIISVSGDNEPQYWAYQMRGATDGNWMYGFSTVNEGKMRINPVGDVGPYAVMAAAADGVTLDPTDGLTDTEKAWLYNNMINYNNFIYSNIHDKLHKGITVVNDNVIIYPTDALRHNNLTQNIYNLSMSISRRYQQQDYGFQIKGKCGLESYMRTADLAYIERIISTSGRTAQLNHECGGIDTAVQQQFQQSCAIAYMSGFRYHTPYNTINMDPHMLLSFPNELNRFTGDPAKIATLVDKRRKSLTTAYERDAYWIKKEVEAILQPSDTLGNYFKAIGDAAYNSHDFKVAYENYVKAECAGASILPAPYQVSGTQGTLSPYPLKVTSVASANTNIVITDYVNTWPQKLEFTSLSTVTGTVNYVVTPPFNANHDVYVNGSMVDHIHGTDITFNIEQTAGVEYNIVISTTAPTTTTTPSTPVTPTPEPGENVARYKAVITSSSLEISPWSANFVKDGLRTCWKGAYGWSSNSNLSTNHTEWVKIDLGYNEVINGVSLVPRNDGEWIGDQWVSYVGEHFPVDFTIQVSEDNTNWKTVVTKTGYSKPATPQIFSFDSQIARYIKVEGTNLRPLNSEYRMQFAEIEVFKSPSLFNDDFNSGLANWNVNSGTWDISDGTFRGKSGADLATVAGKQFSNATISFKLKINNDMGNSENWGGIILRKANEGDDYGNSGILVYLRNSGELCLYKTGFGNLQTAMTGVIPSDFVDIKIVMRGNNYKVYLNGSSTPAIDVNDSTYNGGYLSFRTACDVSYDNIVVKEETTLFKEGLRSGIEQWTQNIGSWNVVSGELDTNGSCLATITGRQFENATIKLKLKILNDYEDNQNWAGILLRKTNATDDFINSGILFYYRNNGQICLYKHGVGDLQTCDTGIIPNKFVDVKIVMNGGNYKVYINGSKTASLDVTDTTYTSGFISLRTNASNSRFDNIVITPL